jgi:hypothetical protein
MSPSAEPYVLSCIDDVAESDFRTLMQGEGALSRAIRRRFGALSEVGREDPEVSSGDGSSVFANFAPPE